MMMTMRATAALVAALALGACKHEGDGTGGSMGGADRQRTTSPAIAELLAGVPGNAAAIGFIDLADTPWSQITGGWLMPLDTEARQSLDKELRDYLMSSIGLDVSRLQYAVAFASGPPPHVAMLARTVGGTLKLPGGSEYEGGKLWLLDRDNLVTLAIRGDVMLLGDRGAVRDALDTLAGKRKAVTADNKALVDLLHKDSSGAVFAFAAIKPKDLPLPPQIAGIERITMTLHRHGIAAAIEGDDAAISRLQTTVDQAFAQMQTELERAHAEALAGKTNPLEGASAIVAAAYGKSFAARVKPRRSGNRLSASLDLGAVDSATTTIAVIGIMSAVAIPAFMDYMKRSKKTEAALQLNKIGKNAKRAYMENSMFPTGSTPITPAAPCCGQPNNHCAAVPQSYTSDPVWTMLDFEIDEPTLFQYVYRGSADGQSFVAQAIGDLDCDGTFITYELNGSAAGGMPRITLTEPPPGAD
jgi:hypothetical protein